MRDTQNAAESLKIITSHAVGTVFTNVEPSGVIKIAAMYYTVQGRTSLRVPMGKRGVRAEGQVERLTDTQVSEAVQEAADDPTKFDFELMFNKRFVYYDVVPDQDNPNTELHFKGFFAAKVTAGILRTFRLVEPGGRKGDETLDPLTWYEARNLIDRMYEPRASILCHARAVVSTLVHCVQTFPQAAVLYGDIAEEAAEQVRPSSQYQEQVRAYVVSLQG